MRRFYEKQSHSRMADLAEQALGDLRGKRLKLMIRGGQYELQKAGTDGDEGAEGGGGGGGGSGGMPSMRSSGGGGGGGAREKPPRVITTTGSLPVVGVCAPESDVDEE